MSAGPQPLSVRAQDQIVLGELLHSLSQPLTTLRCSLELSGQGFGERQQQAVSAALEQTDRAIGVVRLMREYLDSESSPPSGAAVSLDTVLQTAIEQLSSVAAARHIRLEVTGGCNATIAIAGPRLLLALQHLIGILVEETPHHGWISFHLEQTSVASLLCAQNATPPNAAPIQRDPANSTLRRVKLAIAGCVLESAGASIAFEQNQGFTIRFPQQSPSSLPRTSPS